MPSIATHTPRRSNPVTGRAAVSAFLAIAGVAGALILAPAAASAQAPPSVAFTSFREGAVRVYAVNTDGSGVRPLTKTPGAVFEGSPAYSPDGRRIAYTCGNFELCVMNADGTAQARLTTNDWPRELRYDTAPAWSPDGTTIAFVRTVAGKDEIWLVAPDGSGLRQLPVAAGVNASPTFSADSRMIAFEHAADETGGDDDLPSSSDSAIQVIGADGSAVRTLTGPGVNASDPAWSPDGAQIAYTRSNDDDIDQIFVMNADGSAQRRLTSRTLPASDPAWSPDSARIVFSGLRKGEISLFHVAAAGGKPIRLRTGAGLALDPAWQPAGATTPAQQTTPTAGPPSAPTPDAQMVGVLLRSFGGLVAVFTSLDPRSASALLATAKRMERLARQSTRAARSLRPVSRQARSVRRTVLESMSLLKDFAKGTRHWSRSVRRHDRRAARKSAESIPFALGFGVLLPLAAASGEAGVSQAML